MKLSNLIKSKLEKLSEEELMTLYQIFTNKKQYEMLKILFFKLIAGEEEYMLLLNSASETLRTDHAYAKGRKNMLRDLMMFFEGSPNELERRDKNV
jgi:hypothetical protein